MGLIKEGKITGSIPSKEAFAVHYPGYPSSTSRAVQTLGGTQAINKARESQSNKLELRFRPEDPYAHPTLGELRPCNSLLLKISKKKSSTGQITKVYKRQFKRPPPTVTDSGTESEKSETVDKAADKQTSQDQISLCAEIVARVSERYHFDGMADYQHVVAVHADVARRKKRNWSEAEELLSEECSLPDVQDDVMLLLPPLFSQKDVPENLVLRSSSSKKNNEKVLENRNEIYIEALQIEFSAKDILLFDLLCSLYHFYFHVNWKESITPGSDQWDWHMAVSKLFEERPIWPKESLFEHLLDKGLKFTDHMRKRLLLGLAYNFLNGPFLRFWIKKGYDPRVDPESRIYQRLDFRVHPDLQGYRDASKKEWTSLQLFEVVDDFVQEEIRKPPRKKTCDISNLRVVLQSRTGWFSEWELDSIRHRITMRYLSVYPGLGAEKYLKAASNDFQKARKMCKKEALKIDHEEHHVNKGDENTEKPANTEGDDEEEEISLQSQSYLNFPIHFIDPDPEDNSRTYLQELFGGFPFKEAGGNKIQDANDSEEEYQIYEPESNGSDSDDFPSGFGVIRTVYCTKPCINNLGRSLRCCIIQLLV
ncbi:hypothetical protein ACFE04_006725 [Oxalis oulophora]